MGNFEDYLHINNTLLSVDIGFDSVKIILLKKNGHGKNYLCSFNIVELGRKPGVKTQMDTKTIGQAILQAKKTARPRISERLTVSGLPESKVFTKIIQVPKMKEEEMRTAVPYEAVRHIPIPQTEIYLDWINVGEFERNTFDILIVAAPKKLVDSYSQLFKEIGLDLVALETKPIAAARAIFRQGEQNIVLILDIGAAATGISIADMGVIKFTYTIPHGGDTLTRSIVNYLKLSPEQAEKLKRETGFKKNDHPETIKAMEQVMNDILEEVNNAIKFYESRTKPPRKITEIRICGGGALTPDIVPYVSQATGKQTNIANPFVNIEPKSWRRLQKEQMLRLTTAVGLALRERY